MIKRTYFIFSILMFLCAGISAQNIWNKRASVGGSKRERGISFSIASRGYIGLGQDTLNLMLNDIWEYDQVTNSWSQKANFPGVARRDAAAFSIGTKGYVGTGIDNADAFLGLPQSDFWEYNPATNSWTNKAAYPGNFGSGAYYVTGFAVSGKGYFCCGKLGASTYSNELWEYTPTTNSWLQKSNFPGTVRYGGVAFTIGSNGYFGTGTDENVFTNDFYKYTPATDLWAPIYSFPGSERFSCSSFTLNNNGYILLGTDGGYKDELWQYDPLINYWFPKSSLPGGARRSSCTFSIGGKGYAGTGKGPTGTRKDFWEYLPSIPVGIDEHADDVFTGVYPNPLIESATIKISELIFNSDKNLFFDLINLQGKILVSDKISSSTFTINRNALTSGIYFISIRSNENRIASKKIILQ
ncbi:MAG: T9SS type A sorting domain-containing protein [Bacteroidetes bacterium]|nr:T9SS type A sorting domain-containing protein [Bacteroidota bacterium]